jgi:hypothetical protein
MDGIKRKLFDLIGDMSGAELAEVLDFAGYLRWRREREVFGDLLKASESSKMAWIEDCLVNPPTWLPRIKVFDLKGGTKVFATKTCLLNHNLTEIQIVSPLRVGFTM